MKNTLSLFFGGIVWFAVIAQYVLMLNANTTSFIETTVRFVSYFTILTNIIVGVYLTRQFIRKKKSVPGHLTAITVYITFVGISYQVLLRHTWQPQGFQLIVDELLHSLIPVLVIIYWYLYEDKKNVAYPRILSWMVYPIAYLVLVLIRGKLSGFYPYYFINTAELGFIQVMFHVFLMLVAFTLLSILFIWIGRRTATKMPG